MSLRPTGVVVALLSTVLVMTVVTGVHAPSAYAGSARAADQANDAPDRWDLRWSRHTFNKKRTVSLIRVEDLRGSGTQVIAVDIDNPEAADRILTVRRANGTVRNRLEHWTDDGLEKVKCDIKARWALRRNRVKISFPSDCLSVRRTSRFTTLIGRGHGRAGDPWDWDNGVRVRYN